MQSLIVIFAVFICIYSIVWIKNYGHSFIADLRIFIKRLALHVMSFSWVMVLVTVLMIACYSDICSLLQNLLSANSFEDIKSLIHLTFGVDSAVVVLQMLALYSLITSFVSCLVFAVGMIILVAYRAILKVSKANFVDDTNCPEYCNRHSIPTFKVYLKYNS